MGTYLRQVYPNELWHHGINGQKWGDRNGPPYPLSYGQHTPEERHKNKGLMRTLRKAAKTAKRVAKGTGRAIRKTANTVRAVDQKVKEFDSKMKMRQLEKKKDKLIRTGDADELYKNRRLFDNDEIDQIIERLHKEETLKLMTTPVKNIPEKTKNEGYERLKHVADETAFWVGKASNIAQSGYTLFDNGRKAYNVYAAYKNNQNGILGNQTITGKMKPMMDLNNNGQQNKYFENEMGLNNRQNNHSNIDKITGAITDNIVNNIKKNQSGQTNNKKNENKGGNTQMNNNQQQAPQNTYVPHRNDSPQSNLFNHPTVRNTKINDERFKKIQKLHRQRSN